jgi:CrcB protein
VELSRDSDIHLHHHRQLHELPRDSDVDLHDARQRRELHPDVLIAIAVGGALGACARYGIGLAFPAGPTGFPWATLWVNVTGCFLIGILMVLVTDVWTSQRLIRPFLGVGVLGGYTTFSTYVVDIQRLVNNGAAGVALLYLAGTLFAAVLATAAGIGLTRRVVR